MGNNLSELGKKFALLKELRSHHEHMAELLGSELATLGAELFKEFVSSEQISFRLDGSRLFRDGQDRIVRPLVKYKGTIVQHQPFFNLLKANEEESLIKIGVHDATLSSWITERKTKNLEMPNEAILKVFQITTAKVTRAPSSAKGSKSEGEEA